MRDRTIFLRDGSPRAPARAHRRAVDREMREGAMRRPAAGQWRVIEFTVAKSASIKVAVKKLPR